MFSRKFLAAIEAVLYIALNSAVKPVSSKEICHYQQLQPRYLERILQALVKAGILHASRGPKGGYTLAKDKRKLSIEHIFVVINQLKDSSDSNYQSQLRSTLVQPFINDIQGALLNELCNLTIEDLCRKAQESGIKGKKPDFVI